MLSWSLLHAARRCRGQALRIVSRSRANRSRSENAPSRSTRPPSVTIGEPSHVGAYTATLNGTVDPEGTATTFQFEYGTTTSFTSHTTSSVAGAGTTGKALSAALTGLLPDHVYHARMVATNSRGGRGLSEECLSASASGVAPVKGVCPVSIS